MSGAQRTAHGEPQLLGGVARRPGDRAEGARGQAVRKEARALPVRLWPWAGLDNL